MWLSSPSPQSPRDVALERKKLISQEIVPDDIEAPSSSSRLLEEVAIADGERKNLLKGNGRVHASVGQGSKEACTTLVHSWFTRKFAVGCAILFPVVVTVYVTWWFLTFFDNFFSPIYFGLFHFHVFGLGFITSMVFIFVIGVFFSSWMGTALLGIGEYLIKRLPLVKHVYSASKQVSAALNPENEASKAFKECVLIRHPRQGEYAFAFVTGRTKLQTSNGDMSLCSVYVPTNHVYIGDVFLLEDKDIIQTNLSVRAGLELVVSVGMALPKILTATGIPEMDRD